MARVLGRKRLSRFTDESTSIERQTESIEKWADLHNHEIVGWATDVDVSRSIDPFESPEFGPWLRDRLDEWDIVVSSRLDRMACGSIQLNKLFELCGDHGKSLASVSENIDTSTWIGRLIANVIAGVAEGELEGIRERTGNAFKHNYLAGKWRGGQPPFGYRPEKDDQGDWRLVLDPVMSALVRRIADELIAGKLPSTVCAELNREGVLTPTEYNRQRLGKPLKGSLWRTSNLTREMATPTLLGQVMSRPVIGYEKGQKVYADKPVLLRNDDGSPIVRSAPVLDRETFDAVGTALAARAGKKTPYKKSQALLLRVLTCGVCGQAMYYNKGRSAMYYRCVSASLGQACGNRGVLVEVADNLLTDAMMSLLAKVPRTTRIYQRGEDHAAELAEVVAELTDVAGLIGTGPFKSGPARTKLEARADALDARRVVLESKPSRPAGYRYEPTGELFGDWWKAQDATNRNIWLRDHGVKLNYNAKAKPTWAIELNETHRMLKAVNAGITDEVFKQWWSNLEAKADPSSPF